MKISIINDTIHFDSVLEKDITFLDDYYMKINLDPTYPWNHVIGIYYLYERIEFSEVSFINVSMLADTCKLIDDKGLRI